MYNYNNLRAVKKAVNAIEDGGFIYLNMIGATPAAIDQVRTYVKSGVLIPDLYDASKIYNDIEAVRKGDVILPQLYYRKGA